MQSGQYVLSYLPKYISMQKSCHLSDCRVDRHEWNLRLPLKLGSRLIGTFEIIFVSYSNNECNTMKISLFISIHINCIKNDFRMSHVAFHSTEVMIKAIYVMCRQVKKFVCSDSAISAICLHVKADYSWACDVTGCLVI